MKFKQWITLLLVLFGFPEGTVKSSNFVNVDSEGPIVPQAKNMFWEYFILVFFLFLNLAIVPNNNYYSFFTFFFSIKLFWN